MLKLLKGLSVLACITIANCIDVEKLIRIDGNSMIADAQLKYGITNNLTIGAFKIAVIGDSRAAGGDLHNGEPWPL